MKQVEIIYQIIGILGGILTIYTFFEEKKSLQIILVIIGVILLIIYTRWTIEEYFTKKFNNLKNNFLSENKNIKNKIEKMDKEISWFKGWISGFKSKKGIIDPLTLILIVALIIIIILILKDKI